MGMKNISYSDFLDTINDCKEDFGFVYPEYKEIVKFLVGSKNPYISYFIEDYSGGIDYDRLEIMRSFGIIVEKSIFNVSKRLLIINPNEGKTVSQLLAEYRNNLDMAPRDDSEVESTVLPTHFVVLTDKTSVIEKYYNELSEIISDISLTQSFTEDFTSDHVLEQISKSLSAFKVTKDNLFDIKEYCELIADTSSTSNGYMTLVNNVINEINEKCGNRIICNSSLNSKFSTIYPVIASELFLRFNRKFYAQTNETRLVCSIVMDSLFNSDAQLMEELVRYFVYLPSALVSYEDFGVTYHMIDQQSKKLLIHCSYCEYGKDEIDEVYNETLEISQIDIVPINKFYDLDSVGDCMNLKSLIMDMYSRLKCENGVIDVTKLLFFKKRNNDGTIDNEKLYYGYVIDTEFSVDAFTFLKGYKSIKTTLNYDKLRVCYPLSIFLDGRSSLSLYLKEKIPNDLLTPVKTNRNMSAVLTGILMTRNSFKDDTETKPSTIYLMNGASIKFRQGFYENFITTVGLSKTRELLDAFGSLNFSLVSGISIGGRYGS